MRGVPVLASDSGYPRTGMLPLARRLRAFFYAFQFAEIMIGIYRYNGRFFTTRPSRIELAQGGLKEELSPL